MKFEIHTATIVSEFALPLSDDLDLGGGDGSGRPRSSSSSASASPPPPFSFSFPTRNTPVRCVSFFHEEVRYPVELIAHTLEFLRDLSIQGSEFLAGLLRARFEVASEGGDLVKG